MAIVTRDRARALWLQTLTLIPAGIAIDFVGKTVAQLAGLPIFLDTIGTVIVAIIAGPWAGAVTGLLGNTVFALIIRPTALPFGLINMLSGIVAGYLYRRGMFRSFWRIFVSGLIIAAVNTVGAVPIIVFVFGGATGTGADLVTSFFVAAGHKLFAAVLSSQAIISPTDKLITVFIAWAIVLRLPARWRSRSGPNLLWWGDKVESNDGQ